VGISSAGAGASCGTLGHLQTPLSTREFYMLLAYLQMLLCTQNYEKRSQFVYRVSGATFVSGSNLLHCTQDQCPNTAVVIKISPLPFTMSAVRPRAGSAVDQPAAKKQRVGHGTEEPGNEVSSQTRNQDPSTAGRTSASSAASSRIGSPTSAAPTSISSDDEEDEPQLAHPLIRRNKTSTHLRVIPSDSENDDGVTQHPPTQTRVGKEGGNVAGRRGVAPADVLQPGPGTGQDKNGGGGKKMRGSVRSGGRGRGGKGAQGAPGTRENFDPEEDLGASQCARSSAPC